MADHTTTVEIPISGMTCASCVARNEKALRRLDGVSAANVNFATEKAQVTFDPALIDVGRLTATIEQAGYDVPTATDTLAIGGMTCASCVGRVEKALRRAPGVLKATVNLATERATVEYLPGTTGRDDLAAAVRRAGYEVVAPARGPGAGAGGAAGSTPGPTAGASSAGTIPAGDDVDPEVFARRAAYLRLRRKVVIGAVLSALIFLGSMGFAFVPGFLTNGWVLWRWPRRCSSGSDGSSTGLPSRRRATPAPPWTPSSSWGRRPPTSTVPPACSSQLSSTTTASVCRCTSTPPRRSSR